MSKEDADSRKTYRRRCRFGNLLCKGFDLFIEHGLTSPLLLFHFNFVFISVTMLAFTIASFVELDVRSLAEELDILKQHDETET